MSYPPNKYAFKNEMIFKRSYYIFIRLLNLINHRVNLKSIVKIILIKSKNAFITNLSFIFYNFSSILLPFLLQEALF